MRRKIVTIDDQLYLMDFDNITFKVERTKEIEIEVIIEESKEFSKIEIHNFKLFCCNIKKVQIDKNTQLKYINHVEKWGCVNQDNEEIIPCIYDRIEYWGGEFLHVWLSNPTETSYEWSTFSFEMNIKGVPCHTYYTSPEREKNRKNSFFFGYQAISNFKCGLAIGLKNGYQGIVKEDGNVFWKPEYDSIDMNGIENNHIIAKKGDETITMLYFEMLKCWRYLSKNYSFLKYDGEYFHLKINDKICIITSSDNILIPPIYSDLVFYKDFIVATNSQGKKGIIKRSDFHTILLNFEYDEIEDRIGFLGNNLVIIKNNLQGVCTVNGEILIEPIFKDVEIYPNTYGEGLIGFEKKHGEDIDSYREEGFINLDGEIVLLFHNEGIERGFEDGRAVISNRYSRKIINKQGKILEEERFKSDWDYSNDEELAEELARDTWDALTDEGYPENGYDASDLLDSMGRG